MAITSLDLCGPNPNPMTVNEALHLKQLVKSLAENPVIVQIGAERGTSTLAMLEERPDAFIFSIDIGEATGELNNLVRANLEWRRVVRVLGRSQDIGQYWPHSFDFLFIDGDHSEKGVEGDILAWLPKLKSGGIISFHDYIQEPIPPEIKGRVVYAVDRLMGSYERILWTERLIAFRK